jgi:hypothetical protein
VLRAFRRWRDRVFRRVPLEGDDRRAGKNLDAYTAAAAGSQYTGGVGDHGDIPPNYVPPVDEGRPRH